MGAAETMAGGTVVCRDDELAPGEKRRIVVGRRPLVLCRAASGRYYAVSDNCPHQGASMSAGALGGAMQASAPGRYAWGRPGEVLRCPWHAWEFDVTTGCSLWGQADVRLASYPVTIVDGDVVVSPRAARAGG